MEFDWGQLATSCFFRNGRDFIVEIYEGLDVTTLRSPIPTDKTLGFQYIPEDALKRTANGDKEDEKMTDWHVRFQGQSEEI